MSDFPVSTAEGWAFPSTARKAHYFRDGRSLCGRYGWFARHNEGLEADNGLTSKDDCAECRRRFANAIEALPEGGDDE